MIFIIKTREEKKRFAPSWLVMLIVTMATLLYWGVFIGFVALIAD
jgi:hypothetical protein